MRTSLPWEITITAADNGYIVSWKEESEYEQDFIVSHQEVFAENENDELMAIEQVLWFILDYFNELGTKHSPVRLKIIREENEKR